MKRHKILSIETAYAVFFVMLSAVLYWKCRYGYADLDEAFYLTIPYRLIQGDKILYEEWHATQLSALALIPVLKTYIRLTGSTAGIYLFIRYLYTTLKILISALVYLSLRKYHKSGAVAASICFLSFSFCGLMVLSYNSLAIGGLLCALLLLMTDKKGLRGGLSYVMAGISLSFAVWGIPHLAVVYPAYVLTVAFLTAKKRDKQGFNLYSLAWVSVGIGLMVAIFLIYTLSKVSVSEIIETLPHILYEDSEHPPKEIWGLIPGYLARVATGNNRNYLTLGLYAAFSLEFVAILADRKRKLHAGKYLVIAAFLTVILQAVYLTTNGYINHMMFAPNVLALFIAVLVHDETIHKVFCFIWIPGMAFSFLEYIASNTGFSGISGAASVATVGSILIICIAAGKIPGVHRIGAILCVTLVLMTIAAVTYYRCTYIFWEDGISKQTRLIGDGPQAGLYVSDEKYDYYQGILDDTQSIRDMDQSVRVLYISDKSLYLAGNQRCASYSPLSYGISGSRDLLYEYYAVHPDKIADIIYIEYGYKDEVADELCSYLGMEKTRKNLGYLLYRFRD